MSGVETAGLYAPEGIATSIAAGRRARSCCPVRPKDTRSRRSGDLSGQDDPARPPRHGRDFGGLGAADPASLPERDAALVSGKPHVEALQRGVQSSGNVDAARTAEVLFEVALELKHFCGGGGGRGGRARE